MTAADIITQGTAVAGFANVLVNVIRISFPNLKAIPLVAAGASIAVAFLFAMANGIGFDRAAIAFTVLIGLSGTGGAMLIAMAQDKAADKSDSAVIAKAVEDYDVRKETR